MTPVMGKVMAAFATGGCQPKAVIEQGLDGSQRITPRKRVRRESRCFPVGGRPTRELLRSAR